MKGKLKEYILWDCTYSVEMKTGCIHLEHVLPVWITAVMVCSWTEPWLVLLISSPMIKCQTSRLPL